MAPGKGVGKRKKSSSLASAEGPGRKKVPGQLPTEDSHLLDRGGICGVEEKDIGRALARIQRRAALPSYPTLENRRRGSVPQSPGKKDPDRRQKRIDKESLGSENQQPCRFVLRGEIFTGGRRTVLYGRPRMAIGGGCRKRRHRQYPRRARVNKSQAA